MATDRGRRRGVVLIEVMTALVIVATLSGSIVAASAESAAVEIRVRQADREARLADRFITAVSLWPREDLDRHLGARPEGPWLLEVERPEPELYTVTLRDSSGRRRLLTTELYRPDSAARAGVR